MFSIIEAAGWPIWPLILCSVIALALIIERFVSLRCANIAPPALVDEVIAITSVRKPTDEIIANLERSSALGEILASGLRVQGANVPRGGEEGIRAVMESAGRKVVHRLEKYLGALATIASAAPLLGLLGTVIGMIEIFGSQSGTGSVSSGDPIRLAHGISIALYNTAFGLIVAIPTLFFWRYFRARVNDYILTLELASERFARYLGSMDKEQSARNGQVVGVV